jgi:hypothetical protein
MAYGVNAPFGLQSIATNVSSTLTGQQTPLSIASSYATALYSGDPVAFLGNGTIGICPPGTPAIGVLNQVIYYDPQGNLVNQPYWPAGQATLGSLNATAYVFTDPNLVFNIQVSNSSNTAVNAAATVTAAQIGQNANFAIGGGTMLTPVNLTSGSTRTGQSAYYLDASTISADSSLNLKIIGFTNYIGNAASVPFNNVLVTLNNQTLKANGTGFTNDPSGKNVTVTGATYTALISDEIIECSHTPTGTVTVTVPTASAFNRGKKYWIKDTGGMANMNNITISAATGNVDAGNATIATAYGHATVISDGTQWWTI